MEEKERDKERDKEKDDGATPEKEKKEKKDAEKDWLRETPINRVARLLFFTKAFALFSLLLATASLALWIYVTTNSDAELPGQRDTVAFWCDVINAVITGIFGIEITVRYLAIQRIFWASKWNILDLILFVLCVGDIIFGFTWSEGDKIFTWHLLVLSLRYIIQVSRMISIARHTWSLRQTIKAREDTVRFDSRDLDMRLLFQDAGISFQQACFTPGVFGPPRGSRDEGKLQQTEIPTKTSVTEPPVDDNGLRSTDFNKIPVGPTTRNSSLVELAGGPLGTTPLHTPPPHSPVATTITIVTEPSPTPVVEAATPHIAALTVPESSTPTLGISASALGTNSASTPTPLVSPLLSSTPTPTPTPTTLTTSTTTGSKSAFVDAAPTNRLDRSRTFPARSPILPGTIMSTRGRAGSIPRRSGFESEGECDSREGSHSFSEGHDEQPIFFHDPPSQFPRQTSCMMEGIKQYLEEHNVPISPQFQRDMTRYHTIRQMVPRSRTEG